MTAGTTARTAFETGFKTDIATHLGVTSDRARYQAILVLVPGGVTVLSSITLHHWARTTVIEML